MRTLIDLLDLTEQYHAGRIAVTTHGVDLTYGELFSRSRRLARLLLEQGVTRGDRVAVLARNSFRYLEANFACAFAGAVLVPINFRLAPAEIESILARVKCRLVLGPLDAIPGHSVLGWDDDVAPGGDCRYEKILAATEPLASSTPAPDPATTAQIFFTSGTTGLPKGACLTHGNLVASALDAVETLQFHADDVWLHAAPMFHLVDAFAIWGITIAGGRHIATHFEPARFGELVARDRITKTSLPPTLLDWISRQNPGAEYDLSSLDLISYGGSPMQDAVYRLCFSALGCRLLQAYGLTEGSGFVCHEVAGDNPDPSTVINTVGGPTRHARIMLRTADGATVGENQVGEIWIAGERVFREYWQDPVATGAAFDGLWYATGDLGMRDERGRYRIVGRSKELIISGGENVYPAEVVNALVSHPAVSEAAVFGVPSERWGEEVRALVHLAPDSGIAIEAEALIAYCRTLIGGYKTPKRIDFSATPLPKSGTGKIAVTAIRDALLHEELS